MIWLNSAAERAHAWAFRPRYNETQRLAMALVMDSVHPGNLGALPPSPRALLSKAHDIGLLTIREATA